MVHLSVNTIVQLLKEGKAKVVDNGDGSYGVSMNYTQNINKKLRDDVVVCLQKCKDALESSNTSEAIAKRTSEASELASALLNVE